ncbi:unnamed protein product [Rotaria sp. Silwood2]|nr:unnamed protein product [Rotaria sp. Silwood2]CAF4075950.1 unnamed protein product [Rotaria sp. Silwood2]
MENTKSNEYNEMTSEEKDNLCDNNIIIIQDLISKHNRLKQNTTEILNQNENEKDNSKQQFKRQLTSTSQYGDDLNVDQDSTFQVITNPNKRKQQKLNNRNLHKGIDNDNVYFIDHNSPRTTSNNNGRLFFNRNRKTNDYTLDYSYEQQTEKNHRDKRNEEKNICQTLSADDESERNNINQMKNDKYHNTNNTNINISQHALNYAIEQHLPLIYIKCNPKVSDNTKAKGIINALITHIKDDFYKLNKYYNQPLGFEYWYINKKGDLICHTRQIELYVYLSDTHNYPTSVESTILEPLKPKHLPEQHSLVLKYVPNYITIDDIQNEIGIDKDLIFNLEEMNGSRTDKYRHIRLEIKTTSEYNSLLKKGGITIDGLLIEIKEFLSPPRILICTKCNDPGHVRKNCKLEYEACRQCGEDRSVGNHKKCKLCCHRCKQEHMATDYQCHYIIDYHRCLLQQIKQKPYLLPPNVQIFIPTEYRENGNKNNKIINNTTMNNQNKSIPRTSDNNQQIPFNIKSFSWPSLPINQQNNKSNVSSEEAIWIELKRTQSEIEKINVNFENKVKNLQSKYNDNIIKLKTSIQVLTAQTKYHNENIERCYSTMNKFIPILSTTFDIAQKMISNLDSSTTKKNHNQNEIQILLQQIATSIENLNEYNNLLTMNQNQMKNLSEQQGQLLLQAVNYITIDNE